MALFALQYRLSSNWTRRGQEKTRATNVWHSDDNYVLQPPWATVLRSVVVPPCGGDTLFADMGLAMADLSENVAAHLRSLAVVADWRPAFPHYQADASSTSAYAALREMYPLVAHPLVRTHPVSGAEAIYCNAIYSRGLRHWRPAGAEGSTLGPSPPEADALLRELLTLPGVPEYQCRVRWDGPGDVLIWDNRRLQHYAVSDYGSQDRHMEHCASLGDVPYVLHQDGTASSSQLLPVGAELSDLPP